MSHGIAVNVLRVTATGADALVWVVGERFALRVQRSLGQWEPLYAIDVNGKTRRELPGCFALDGSIIESLNEAAYGKGGLNATTTD